MDLINENAFLRQQMIILSRQPKRPALTWRERVLLVLLANKLRTWKESVLIVQPDTLLRWHPEIFRRVWKCKSKALNKCATRKAHPFGTASASRSDLRLRVRDTVGDRGTDGGFDSAAHNTV